ncbi:MAG: MG2 domain-containing protein, partial [Thermonemataceae bacterium]|nr:MG2 domain-containing protein [Thermonemataceae bacterium]
MKKLFTRLLALLGVYFAFLNPNYAQTMYEKLWKQVSEAESKGLPETARKSVEEIYQKAQKEANNAQLVKAVIHKLKYFEVKEEEDLSKALKLLKEEADKAKFPTKNLLHSMLAEVYWRYYEENRWRFSERTQMAVNGDDLNTWTLEKIAEEVRLHYQKSLEQPEELKNTKIDVFDEIINKGTQTSRILRPTLYDFLAWRAIYFFQNTEPELTRPVYYFQLKEKAYAASVEEFINATIQSKDTESFKYITLKIYQELLKLNQKNEDIFLHTNIARLDFVYNHSVLPDKSELYIKELEKLQKSYQSNPQNSFVYYAIANYWYGLGGKYNPEKASQYQFHIKKAYDICQEAINLYPKAEGTQNCKYLQNVILQKSIRIQMEQTEPSKTYFKALISYKNVSKIYYKLIKVSREEVAEQRRKQRKNYDDYEEKKFLSYFIAKNATKRGVFELPNPKDYQNHNTEIPFEPLDTGTYMLLISEAEGFSLDKNVIAYNFFTISDLAYIHKNLPDGSTEFYVVDRQSGESIANVEAEVFSYKYNSKSGDYERKKAGKYTSDSKGYFKIPYVFEMRDGYKYRESSLDIDFRKTNDFFSTDEIDNSYYNYGVISQNTYEEPHSYDYTHLFLDRAIYRPGQTVYFKGLVYQRKGKENKILSNRQVTVSFYDVNYQVVEQKNFVTNEYGTFNGFFIAPKTGLTGEMHIQSSISGSAYFSVEEYKRP